MDMTMILVYTHSLHTHIHTHTPIDTHSQPLRAWRQLTAGPCACFEKKEKQKLNKRKLQCYANPAGQHKALNTTSAR